MTIDNPTRPADVNTAGHGLGRIGAENAHDLVTRVVPALLGHHPAHDHLMVITLSGPRIAAHAEVPLPDPRQLSEHLGPELADDAAVTLPLLDTEPLLLPDADSVILIGYGDPDRDDDLRRLADLVPLPVNALLRVHADRWWRVERPPEAGTQHASAARHSSGARSQDQGADR